MRITLAYVGRPRSRALNEAAAEYVARIGHFCEVAQAELKDARQAEAKFAKAQLVALDPAGRAMDSAAFAKWLERLQDTAVRQVVFLVGGANGLPDDLRSRCQLISLSRLTLPHELARVVLAEQIYRAFTIIRNFPYPR